MKKKKFRNKKINLENIDIKNITSRKIVIAFIILVASICLLVVLRQTLARYETISKSSSEIEYAFYVLDAKYQTEEVNIGTLLPREKPYEYIFSVSNFNTKRRTETNLTYDLTFRTTTNLPLEYDVYELSSITDTNTTSIVTSDSIGTDDDGTYFRTIKVPSKEFSYREDKTYFYKLVITFPAEYKDSQYQDIIESIEITIDSKQKLSI